MSDLTERLNAAVIHCDADKDATLFSEAAARIAALEAELDRVRGALEFYADPERHKGANQRRGADDPFTPEYDYYRMDVTRDNGRIARQALSPGEE
jgi:PAS domain-containing protein